MDNFNSTIMKKLFLLVLTVLPFFVFAQDTKQQIESDYNYSRQQRINAPGANDEFTENYNYGVDYYNRAVVLVQKNKNDKTSLHSNSLQKESMEFFKKSLPYMEKCYAVNSKNMNTLIML